MPIIPGLQQSNKGTEIRDIASAVGIKELSEKNIAIELNIEIWYSIFNIRIKRFRLASQQDVAKMANVSYMTVSRVVNGTDNVRPETRDRVLAAIKELSYYPNAAARALNKKRTNNIGIILPKKEYLLTAPFYIELLLSIEMHLRIKGYSLFLGSMHSDEKTKDCSSLYKEGKVDGLIVFAPAGNDPFITKLVEDDIPFTVVLGRSDDVEYGYVDVDNLKSAATIIRYLLGLNHRKIGFVSGNLIEVNAADRLTGYRTELEANGIVYREDLVYYGDWSLESGYNALNSLMDLENPPTAIFCSNDYMAMGVIKAAHDRNILIPEDLSVVGFDDLQYSSFITPALTTMSQPIGGMAVEASDMIVNRIENKDYELKKVILDSDFIIRSSCKEIPAI